MYYRGEKIGFTVSQTTPTADGFELQEDARLKMSLLGATTAAMIRPSAQLDREFVLRSFEFSLDPGTGPVQVSGRVIGQAHQPDDQDARAARRPKSATWTDVPVLSLNLPRRLAAAGIQAGHPSSNSSSSIPATLRSETVTIGVGKREIVSVFAPAIVALGGQRVDSRTNRPIPAFRVEMAFAGLRTSSWVTDTGEVVREESPLGLLVRPRVARGRAAAGDRRRGSRADLLEIGGGRSRAGRRRTASTIRATSGGSGSAIEGPISTSARHARRRPVDQRRRPRDRRPAVADGRAGRPRRSRSTCGPSRSSRATIRRSARRPRRRSPARPVRARKRRTADAAASTRCSTRSRP